MAYGILIENSIEDIKKNKVRSILTSIGIIVGVSSVIMMIGLGSSAKISIRERMLTNGSTTFAVGWMYQSITDKHVSELKQYFPAIQFISPVYKKNDVKLFANGVNGKTRLHGIANEYIYMRGWSLLAGRYFTDQEIAGSANVVIIGNTIAQELFGNYIPIGHYLQVGDKEYRIIGQLAESSDTFDGKDTNNFILVPYTNAAYRYSGKLIYGEVHMNSRYQEDLERLIEDVRQYFRRDHGLAKGVKDDFLIKTSLENIKAADSVSSTMTYLLAGIASISLFVGGVGIMNIMLVSVSERTREIGIRMAVGAKRHAILAQFLFEACTLSAMGGIAGITLGLIGYYFIAALFGWQFILSGLAIFLSFATSVGIGVFFGYYPARKASDLKPIDALRFE